MGYHTNLYGEIDVSPDVTELHLAQTKEFIESKEPWCPGYKGELHDPECAWEIVGGKIQPIGFEKPYYYAEWMERLVKKLGELGYTCNGEVSYNGDEPGDQGTIYVSDNRVEQVDDLVVNPGPSWDRVEGGYVADERREEVIQTIVALGAHEVASEEEDERTFIIKDSAKP